MGAETTHWARFDDLVAGTALRMPPAVEVLLAYDAADVPAALSAVDAATRAGRWAFGYVSYEAAAGLDPALTVHGAPDRGLPLVWFGICDEPRVVPPVEAAGPAAPRGRWTPAWTDQKYRRGVEAVQERIAAGDVYQCNLTGRFSGAAPPDALRFHAELVLNQRPRYAAYLDIGSHVVAASTPELFFEWSGDRLLTRPMKGTAVRGGNEAEDEARRRALLDSPKERAENVMIVDLLRNDVGRIAEVGSVGVPALCVAERYETVWQLTSDVTATVPAGTGLLDIFRALFPSGSVTGAPKASAMALIRSLEDTPRGVYCGAVGWVAPPGAAVRARFGVAIRTVTVERAAETAVYGAGGGITWSSDPDAEVTEMHAKAAILHEPYEEFCLLETMAHVPGIGVRSLDRHLARMAGSARHFGFAFDPDRVEDAVLAAVEPAGPARVRLLVSRSGEVTVELHPLPPPADGPVRLALDAEPVESTSRWLQHKTTRRGVYAVRAGRHPTADDVVLVNERGEVTETTIANLAARIDGTWCTPPLDAGCLPGVERGRLLEGGELCERRLTPADLAAADGLEVFSSLRGRRAAVLM